MNRNWVTLDCGCQATIVTDTVFESACGETVHPYQERLEVIRCGDHEIKETAS